MSETDDALDDYYDTFDEREYPDEKADHDTLYSNPEFAASWLENQSTGEAEAEKRLAKASDEPPAIAALQRAIEQSSWWHAAEYREGASIEKAPGIWRRAGEVPKAVRTLLDDVIQTREWDWATFDSLSPGEAQDLEGILRRTLTQPHGWSLGDLSDRLQEEFDLGEDAAVGIAADTTHNVLATAKMDAYDEMDDSEEFEYGWLNPQDWRTTPVCEGIIADVEAEGGAVSKNKLQGLLRKHAMKWEGTHEGGGTPQRCDVWEPHYQCRSVPSRIVVT